VTSDLFLELPPFLDAMIGLIQQKIEGGFQMNDSIRFFMGLSLLVFFSGCGAGSSELEMKEAQQAMENAQSFSAEALASSDWDEAMKAWEEAQAALKEGKSAKSHFLRAKSRFEKTAEIAKAYHDQISGEVKKIQETINRQIETTKSALDRRRLSSKVRNQIQAILADAESGAMSLESLLQQGDLLKARDTARELQKKLYNAELIMEGKEPTF
jgi:hypothetical protein